jgi:hypothetical protein
VGEHRQEEGLLGREVVQQAGVGDAAAGRDLAEGRGAVADVAEQRDGVVEDLAPSRAAFGIGAT